jgi:hypothetical protein
MGRSSGQYKCPRVNVKTGGGTDGERHPPLARLVLERHAPTAVHPHRARLEVARRVVALHLRLVVLCDVGPDLVLELDSEGGSREGREAGGAGQAGREDEGRLLNRGHDGKVSKTGKRWQDRDATDLNIQGRPTTLRTCRG